MEIFTDNYLWQILSCILLTLFLYISGEKYFRKTADSYQYFFHTQGIPDKACTAFMMFETVFVFP
jgi:hypothetical protein